MTAFVGSNPTAGEIQEIHRVDFQDKTFEKSTNTMLCGPRLKFTIGLARMLFISPCLLSNGPSNLAEDERLVESTFGCCLCFGLSLEPFHSFRKRACDPQMPSETVTLVLVRASWTFLVTCIR